VVAATKPYLVVRSLSGFLITIGHLAFAVSLVWILLRQWRPYQEPASLIMKAVKAQNTGAAA
jgi:cbb3-type cytochrome oxidase subunit 1